jgi:hypothetical protein
LGGALQRGAAGRCFAVRFAGARRACALVVQRFARRFRFVDLAILAASTNDGTAR